MDSGGQQKKRGIDRQTQRESWSWIDKTKRQRRLYMILKTTKKTNWRGWGGGRSASPHGIRKFLPFHSFLFEKSENVFLIRRYFLIQFFNPFFFFFLNKINLTIFFWSKNISCWSEDFLWSEDIFLIRKYLLFDPTKYLFWPEDIFLIRIYLF